MCKDQAFYGVVGLAWVGTMCKTSWSGYNAGVNEKRGNVLSTSEVNHNKFSLKKYFVFISGDFRLLLMKWGIIWECFMILMLNMVVQVELVMAQES